MFKKKYLHRGYRKSTRDWDWTKNHRSKNVDLFSELPKHENMPKNRMSSPDYTPLREFIHSKIGENWNDVYSELLTKIDPKFRYDVERLLGSDRYSYYFGVNRPIYDDDFIPRDNRGRILYDKIFIDLDNILCKKTKEEILSDSIMYVRKQKLLKILESQEDESQENESQEDYSS